MKSQLLFIIYLITFHSHAQIEDSLAVKNGMLHYYSYGKGKPIFILSGGPGVSSKQEDDLAIKLSEKYNAILIDQRGTGKSWVKPMDETTINIENAIEDIEALRKHLKIKKVTISGHSWGGMLAAAYTQQYPKNVRSLIFIGSGELTMEMSPIVSEAIYYRRTSKDSISYLHWNDPETKKADPKKAEDEIRKIVWKSFTYDLSKIDKVLEQASHGSYSNEMGKLMWKSIRKNKFDFTKQKYKGPALVVFGWQDPVGSLTALQYSQTFKNAQMEGIDQCGHMPTVEQPELFYKKVFDFLSRNID